MKKIWLVFLIILFTGCKTKKQEIEETIIINQNQSIQEEKQVDSFIFNDISIIFKNNLSTITFQITNMAEEKNIESIDIAVKNSNGTIITNLKMNCNQLLKKDETKLFTTATDIDLTTAYYLDFEIH